LAYRTSHKSTPIAAVTTNIAPSPNRQRCFLHSIKASVRVIAAIIAAEPKIAAVTSTVRTLSIVRSILPQAQIGHSEPEHERDERGGE